MEVLGEEAMAETVCVLMMKNTTITVVTVKDVAFIFSREMKDVFLVMLRGFSHHESSFIFWVNGTQHHTTELNDVVSFFLHHHHFIFLVREKKKNISPSLSKDL